jgi:tRNA(fMet)-specific endonuclease VapC
MSLFVLDADILTLYRAGHPIVQQRVHSHAPTELAITVMSVEEQLSGWYALVRQARRPDEIAHAYDRLIDAVQFLAPWRILSLTPPALARYEQLKTLKLNVGKMDLRIAAITQEHGGVLVTRNVRDFQRIPHLAIDNWTI